MDERLLRELRALRAKAYGPDADLHDDPDAMHQLAELESLVRGQSPTSTPAPGIDPVPAANPIPTADPVRAADPAPTAAEAPPAAPRDRRGWTRKRITLTWIASVVVAVVASTAITSVVARRVQADPREVAVLGVDSFATWPGIFAGSQELASGPNGPVQRDAFAAFHGMAAYSVGGGWLAGVPGEVCLLVLDSALILPDSNSISGPTYVGCSAGGFAASVQFTVSSELPDGLREAFPDGTGLQFVLDGDEVVVLMDGNE